MKKTEIICDLCGVTVAEKDDCFFSKFYTKIPFIKVPYHYIGTEFFGDCSLSADARRNFHICENCLECIKKDIKEVNVQKTSKI